MGLSKKLGTKVDSERGKPVLWMTLTPVPSSVISSIHPRLVMSLLRGGDKVWFDTFTDTLRIHIDMLHYLGSRGIKFQGFVRYKKNGDFDGGSVFGGTDDAETIQTIFKLYGLDWVGHGHFYFCITQKDLWSRRSEVEKLGSVIHINLLDDVRCVLATYYDHSVEIITTKLEPGDIETAAKDAAISLGLKIELEEDSNG